MKKEKMESFVELHVCNHAREDREACAAKGASELTDELKKWAKANHKGEIKVVRSGCLGKCEKGIALACYPEKNFFVEVVPSDAEEIKKGLLEALRKAKA